MKIYTAEQIIADITHESDAPQEVHLTLRSGDRAWNPANSARPFRGPLNVRYVRTEHGGTVARWPKLRSTGAPSPSFDAP